MFCWVIDFIILYFFRLEVYFVCFKIFFYKKIFLLYIIKYFLYIVRNIFKKFFKNRNLKKN